MASEKVQGAAAGASAGAKIGSVVPGVGTAIGAGIGALAGALFSGGSGTYAQGTGLRAIGYVDKTGFHGTVYGLADNAGQKYQDALTNWAPQPTLSAKAQKAFIEGFGADSPEKLQVDFVGPLTETGSDPQFSDAFMAAVSAAAPPKLGLLDTLAAAVGGSAAVKAPSVNYSQGTAAAVAAPGDPVGIVLASPAPAAGGGLGLIALLAGAFCAVTHG